MSSPHHLPSSQSSFYTSPVSRPQHSPDLSNSVWLLDKGFDPWLFSLPSGLLTYLHAVSHANVGTICFPSFNSQSPQTNTHSSVKSSQQQTNFIPQIVFNLGHTFSIPWSELQSPLRKATRSIGHSQCGCLAMWPGPRKFWDNGAVPQVWDRTLAQEPVPIAQKSVNYQENEIALSRC